MARRIRQIGDAKVEYIPDRSHRHEGSHSITLAGRKILVRPDGRTSGRRRLAAVKRALDATSDPSTMSVVAVEAVVGALILAGASTIEIDGVPLFRPEPEPVAVLRLEVTDDGRISVASIGGSQ
jgi:hypothetical protein